MQVFVKSEERNAKNLRNVRLCPCNINHNTQKTNFGKAPINYNYIF